MSAMKPQSKELRERAACAGHPAFHDLYAADQQPLHQVSPVVVAARDVCASCPVVQQCRLDAASLSTVWGVWGGAFFTGNETRDYDNLVGWGLREKRPAVVPHPREKSVQRRADLAQRWHGFVSQREAADFYGVSVDSIHDDIVALGIKLNGRGRNRRRAS